MQGAAPGAAGHAGPESHQHPEPSPAAHRAPGEAEESVVASFSFFK